MTIRQTVLAMFRTQRLQARAGKSKFGDWNSRLAKELLPLIASLMLRGLKRGKGSKDQAHELASLARERALLVSRSVNETTAKLLEGEGDPFSPARVRAIADTEEAWAVNVGYSLAVKGRGKRLAWQLGAKPCGECRSIKPTRDGKFRGKSGNVYAHPPAHPSCNCTVIER